MDGLYFTDDQKNRIRERIMHPRYSAVEREEKSMKKLTVKRVAVIAAACVMVTGVTAFAGGFISTYTSSSHDYYDYESASDINGHTGSGSPVFPEGFDNGFIFDGGNDVNVEGLDDAGVKQEKWTDLHAVYKNTEGEEITLAVSERDLEEEREATETRVIGGTDVYFNYDEYLSLPDESYELDEETKERMESDDHFFVGYGTGEKETYFYSGISFEKDGYSYHLYSIDDVDRETLFTMAQELLG